MDAFDAFVPGMPAFTPSSRPADSARLTRALACAKAHGKQLGEVEQAVFEDLYFWADLDAELAKQPATALAHAAPRVTLTNVRMPGSPSLDVNDVWLHAFAAAWNETNPWVVTMKTNKACESGKRFLEFCATVDFVRDLCHFNDARSHLMKLDSDDPLALKLRIRGTARTDGSVFPVKPTFCVAEWDAFCEAWCRKHATRGMQRGLPKSRRRRLATNVGRMLRLKKECRGYVARGVQEITIGIDDPAPASASPRHSPSLHPRVCDASASTLLSCVDDLNNTVTTTFTEDDNPDLLLTCASASASSVHSGLPREADAAHDRAPAAAPLCDAARGAAGHRGGNHHQQHRDVDQRRKVTFITCGGRGVGAAAGGRGSPAPAYTDAPAAGAAAADRTPSGSLWAAGNERAGTPPPAHPPVRRAPPSPVIDGGSMGGSFASASFTSMGDGFSFRGDTPPPPPAATPSSARLAYLRRDGRAATPTDVSLSPNGPPVYRAPPFARHRSSPDHVVFAQRPPAAVQREHEFSI